MDTGQLFEHFRANYAEKFPDALAALSDDDDGDLVIGTVTAVETALRRLVARDAETQGTSVAVVLEGAILNAPVKWNAPVLSDGPTMPATPAASATPSVGPLALDRDANDLVWRAFAGGRIGRPLLLNLFALFELRERFADGERTLEGQAALCRGLQDLGLSGERGIPGHDPAEIRFQRVAMATLIELDRLCGDPAPDSPATEILDVDGPAEVQTSAPRGSPEPATSMSAAPASGPVPGTGALDELRQRFGLTYPPDAREPFDERCDAVCVLRGVAAVEDALRRAVPEIVADTSTLAWAAYSRPLIGLDRHLNLLKLFEIRDEVYRSLRAGRLPTFEDLADLCGQIRHLGPDGERDDSAGDEPPKARFLRFALATILAFDYQREPLGPWPRRSEETGQWERVRISEGAAPA